MYNRFFKKRVLLSIVSALFLFLIFLLYKNQDIKNTNTFNLNFKLISEDNSSKFSLVNLDAESKVLATFSDYNKKYGKEMHKNNFWSPESCAAMPNVFLDSNHLVVLETVRKIGENQDSNTNNIFIYDYNKNTLIKSENIESIVGEIYSINKKNIIYFTYKEDYLIKNTLDPVSLKVTIENKYEIIEENPSFRFYVDKKDIHLKIFSNQKSLSYKVEEDKLSLVQSIPEKIFWKVLNENKQVNIYRGNESIILNKKDKEEYKTLKITDKNIIVSKLDLSNFYNFEIEKIDIKSKAKKTLYINNDIENNYFLISSE